MKLTVKQAAVRAGVSESLLYEWCSQGLLTHYRFGKKGRRGKVTIEDSDLDAFLASCRKAARPQGDAPPLRHIKLA